MNEGPLFSVLTIASLKKIEMGRRLWRRRLPAPHPSRFYPPLPTRPAVEYVLKPGKSSVVVLVIVNRNSNSLLLGILIFLMMSDVVDREWLTACPKRSESSQQNDQ